MKKMLLVIALAVVSFANAQKGTYFVSGNVSFWSSKDSNNSSESKTDRFGFSPRIGYQFKDNWTVGIESGFSSDKNVYTYQENAMNNQERISKNYSVGAFVRYSKSLSQMFLLYADLGAGYKNSKETNTNSFSNPVTFTNTFDGVYAGFAPGLFLNIKNNFGLNFGIGGLTYSNTKSDQNNGKNSNFYFNFGQSFNIGLSKNF
ncbi:outer membrane beta-barrel protein [Flavobacterium marginilacus]|uniref:outer membrane beta-barrel protein n=1 Tax=Flavobacterium marginilacus TaxID=3003256 RepID=UPI00248E6E21|nr:outer membrane beta-barrel protein [Flavobacterium marginilacus]